MTHVELVRQCLSVPEIHGILFEDIWDRIVDLDDNGNPFITDAQRIIEPNVDNYLDMKSNWGAGIHGGDCTRQASSCESCYWGDLIGTGNALALAWTRDQMVYLGQSNHLEAMIAAKDATAERADFYLALSSCYKAHVIHYLGDLYSA
jgi:hypothetical protein